jgi:hypothetical protein
MHYAHISLIKRPKALTSKIGGSSGIHHTARLADLLDE